MPVNTDASKSLTVRFKQVPAGSCWNEEALRQLAALMEIEIPIDESAVEMKVSNDANNLATVDAEGGILVPKANLYTEDQDWNFSAPTDVTFDGFGSDIDPTACFINIIARWSSSDQGKAFVTASGSPDTTEKVLPGWYFKSITSSKVVIGVQGATADATFTLQILALPVAAEPA